MDGHWSGARGEIKAWHFCMSPKWLTNNNSENMGHLALGYNDGVLEIWNIKQTFSEGSGIKFLPDGKSLNFLQFSRNAKLLALFGDKIITMREIKTGSILRLDELLAENYEISDINWNYTSEKLVLRTSKGLAVLRLPANLEQCIDAEWLVFSARY